MTIEDLEELRYLNSEIRAVQQEIEGMYNTYRSPAFEKIGSSPQLAGDPTSEAVQKIMALQQKYNRMLNDMTDRRDMVNAWLVSLDNGEIKSIIGEMGKCSRTGCPDRGGNKKRSRGKEEPQMNNQDFWINRRNLRQDMALAIHDKETREQVMQVIDSQPACDLSERDQGKEPMEEKRREKEHEEYIKRFRDYALKPDPNHDEHVAESLIKKMNFMIGLYQEMEQKNDGSTD